jgi:hypothetical protein
MPTVANPFTGRPAPRTPCTCTTNEIAYRVAARYALTKVATIVLRDIPAPGWAWGWFPDRPPRMAIVDGCEDPRKFGAVFWLS